MIGRFVLLLIVGALLVTSSSRWTCRVPCLPKIPADASRSARRSDAAAHGGGTARRFAPQDTPTPSGHPLVGAWLLTFTEPNRAPAQVVFGDDDLVTLIDAAGNRGAGVDDQRRRAGRGRGGPRGR